MGKRSNFERIERDFYPTPYEAVLPLIPHIEMREYTEPCAGDGALIDHLARHEMICQKAFDTLPRRDDIYPLNALDIGYGRQFITNPPWKRIWLHPIIEHLRQVAPTWLLFDADWMHTKQSAPYIKYCQKIVSVGRVKWIPDSKMTGKDNCAWYLFGKDECETVFIGR